jgi:hypothetical protein
VAGASRNAPSVPTSPVSGLDSNDELVQSSSNATSSTVPSGSTAATEDEDSMDVSGGRAVEQARGASRMLLRLTLLPAFTPPLHAA